MDLDTWVTDKFAMFERTSDGLVSLNSELNTARDGSKFSTWRISDNADANGASSQQLARINTQIPDRCSGGESGL